MTKLQKLFFESETQLKIFFAVLNSPSGIRVNRLQEKLTIPKTTIIDNLKKLQKRKFLTGQNFSFNMPYVKFYRKKLKPGKGRPSTLFFVPKYLRNSFLNFYMPEVEILGQDILNKNN